MIHEIYFITAAEVGRFKIGRTVDIRSRLQTLRTSSPVALQCIATTHAPRGEHERFEIMCHIIAEERGFTRVHGEWFEGVIDVDDCAAIVETARQRLL